MHLPRRFVLTALTVCALLPLGVAGCADSDADGAVSGAGDTTGSTGNPGPSVGSDSTAGGDATDSGGSAGAEDARSQAELVAAGRGTYNANCIACHAVDPTQDGALGPAVAGASLELLRARIVEGNYPEGYTPKRPTRVMVALPHLEPKLAEIHAYLNSF